MGTLETPAYTLARKLQKAALSGWHSVDLDEETGIITMVSNNHEVFRWQYPIPHNGVDGAPGLNGLNGKDGKDGKDGLDGKDGNDGVSISNTYIEKDEQGNFKLLIEYSDGRVAHAGYLPEGPKGDTGPRGVQGIQGPPGPKGDPGPQAIAATDYQGEYDDSKTYNSGQYVVASDLNAYICNTDGTSGENPITSNKWDLFAIHGPQGPEGPQGEQGIPGPVIIDTSMSDSSENAVSNRVIKNYVDNHTPKLASKTSAGTVRVNDTYDININSVGDIYPNNLSYQQYQNKSSYSFISKGTLENVISGKFPNKSALDGIKNTGDGSMYLTDDGSYKKASSKLPYTYIDQIDDYLYEIQFDNIHPDNTDVPMALGGCSTFLKDYYVHRNLDYDYTRNASFLVKTPKYKGMAFIDGLYNGQMYNWDMDKVAQLPNRLVDGMNEHGVFISTHIIYNDFNFSGYDGVDNIPMYMIPSMLLENCTDLAEVQNFLSTCADILSVPESLRQAGYIASYFIVVEGHSFIYQVNTAGTEYEMLSLEDMSIPKLTNFWSYAQDTVELTDPQMQSRPTGVERYNQIDSETHLSELRFTKCYEEPTRLSEFIGLRDTTKDSPESQLLSIYSEAHTLYTNRERDGKTWQTMHSVIYNLSDYNMVVNVQEDYSREYDEHDVEDGLNGLSAYEIACNHGFEGTEEEWLYSLQGKDGKGGTYEEDILPHKHAWIVQADEEGHGKWISIKEDIMLNKTIENYDIIRFEIDPADTASGIQEIDFEVADIVFNPTETFKTGGSRLEIIGNWVMDNDTAGSFGAYHTTLSGWFKNQNTFFVDRIGTATTDSHEFRLNRIIGIKELAEQGFNIDKALSRTSENAVTNEAITKAIYDKDYMFATMAADDTVKASAMAEGRNPLTEWTQINTNMDVTSKPGFVKLRAGRTYKLQFHILLGYASASLYIRDEANNIISNRGFACSSAVYTDEAATSIYRPIVDTYVRPYIAKPSIMSGQTANAGWWRKCSYMTVEQL